MSNLNCYSLNTEANTLTGFQDDFFLTEDSPSEELIRYFKCIFELEKSGEEYPVDLDEVWMLVYTRRDNAVAALKEGFMQQVDYQVFLKNQENPLGGRPSKRYRLTVSCLEYFITRKIRAVFEVYRHVLRAYKKKLENENHQPITTFEALELAVKVMREQQNQLNDLEARIIELDARTTTRQDYFSIAGFATLKGFHVGIKKAAELGRKATQLCRQSGYAIDRLPDPRFGGVNIYPRRVLEVLFQTEL